MSEIVLGKSVDSVLTSSAICRNDVITKISVESSFKGILYITGNAIIAFHSCLGSIGVQYLTYLQNFDNYTYNLCYIAATDIDGSSWPISRLVRKIISIPNVDLSYVVRHFSSESNPDNIMLSWLSIYN